MIIYINIMYFIFMHRIQIYPYFVKRKLSLLLKNPFQNPCETQTLFRKL